MRIWQKLYFTTLGVFLLMLNAGLFLSAAFIFRHNLMAEQEQARTESFFLAQNLEHDFSILERNGRYEDGIIGTLVESYQDYYRRNDCEIALERPANIEEMRVETRTEQGGSGITVRVEQPLEEPYGEYVLVYQKRLYSFEKLWSSVKWIFAGISLLMSLLLCPLLYFLLKKLLAPLDELNAGVAQIAAGNYEQRIDCHRKDEIAELAGNVNRMSEEIRRQMTVLREESQKKQQLIDNMAHELRTPLTSIYGYAEYLLRARATEEELYKGLSYIMGESMRLSRMGELMLSMRLYQREDKITTVVETGRLTDHVRKLLEAKLREKEIALCCEMRIKEVTGEEELFVNLFRNLIENAVRASRPGGTVWWRGWIETGECEAGAVFLTGGDSQSEPDKTPGNRMVIFEVEDQGVGMAEDELAKITEPFYRVDRARSRAEGGAGLGLSVAELIVRRYGGTMRFASQQGKGTRVRVELPFYGE